jgi:hypothetical protein
VSASSTRRRFAGCRLFADRDFKAGDNTEHLYRWAMHNHPECKIFFDLRRDFYDWLRLKMEA